MTATAVAGDRVTEPALCSTRNSSTRVMRTEAQEGGKPLYHPSVSKEVVAVGLLGVMVAAWGWALRPVTPLVPAASPLVPVRAIADEDVPRVRFGSLAPDRVVRQVPAATRNPFLRGMPAREVSGASGRVAPVQPQVADAPAQPQPARPRVRLIGMAETREADGTGFVAILATEDGVSHARQGDIVERVFRVHRIAADGVELTVIPDGRTVRLAWRP